MAGFLLHQNAMVLCAHGGQAKPTMIAPNVTVSGQPVATMPAPWVIAGCALPPPPAANGPCVTAMFTAPATRVLINGQPPLTVASQAICAPTGTPLLPPMAQMRVSAL